MGEPHMGRDELERLGTLLFGFSWKSRTADALDVNRKTISRWISDDAVAPWAATRLRAMVNIAPPPGSTDEDDQDDACQNAIKPEITRIVTLAEASGWHPAEVVTAIMALSISEMRARAGDVTTVGFLLDAIKVIQREPAAVEPRCE